VTSTPYVRVAWAVLVMTVGLLALGLVLLPQDRWLTLESVSQLVGNGLLGLACSAVGILRWRPVVWATVAATAAVVVATALTPGPVEYFPGLQNPLGLAGAGPVLDLVVEVGFLVMVAGVFAAAGSLIARWRRARGVERQQLKWLAYAAFMLVVAQVGASLLPARCFCS